MNLTPTQTIIIGVAFLFGVPIVVGIIVGHFWGFWVGMVVTVLMILAISAIAHRWSKRKKGN